MPKKKDLEEKFLAALNKNHIHYIGKIFHIGETALIADYMFGDTIVLFMNDVNESKMAGIEAVKGFYRRFEIILVTTNWDLFVDNKIFTEIYDGKDLPRLIEKLKRMQSNGLN